MEQQKVGHFIQEQRTLKGMTQKELADEIGVSDKTISKWETGRGLPDISSLDALCHALDSNVNELLSGEKLPPDQYSKKAEENIMELMKENKRTKHSATISILMGSVLGILALVFWWMANVGFGSNQPVVFSNLLDIPSVFEMIAICAACVIISGANKLPDILEVIRRCVLPTGVFSSLVSFIVLFHYSSYYVQGNADWKDYVSTLTVNLSIAVLPLLYGCLILLILIPVCRRMQQNHT